MKQAQNPDAALLRRIGNVSEITYPVGDDFVTERVRSVARPQPGSTGLTHFITESGARVRAIDVLAFSL